MTTTPASRVGPATLALLAFAQLIIALDYNIVFVALPTIADALPFTDAGLQWVVSAYAVVFGGFLMLGGRLADLFGRRRLFVAGMALYAVSSLVGGLATEPWLLVVARAVQGLGGAFLAPATLSLVTTLFAEGRERNRALGAWAAAGSSGMVLGSLLGGVLAGWLGWESVFYVNVPLALGGAVAALRLIPADEAAGTSRQLDIPGAVTSTAGVLAIVYGMVQAPQIGWGAAGTWVPIAAGAALLAGFVAIERSAPTPLVPLALFGNHELRRGTATTFLFMASFGAIPYFITIYLQEVEGVSAFTTGLVFMLPSACVLLGTVIGGRASNRWSPRTILVAAWIVGALGMVVLTAMMAGEGPLLLGAVPFAILSLAQGVVFTVMFAVSTSTTAAADQGVASGIATSGQQIGGAVGLAVLVAWASATAGRVVGGSGLGPESAGMAGIVILMIVGLAVASRVGSSSPTSSTVGAMPESGGDDAWSDLQTAERPH
ncbi:MAG: MFS transporter [Phycicoccus sp.]